MSGLNFNTNSLTPIATIKPSVLIHIGMDLSQVVVETLQAFESVVVMNDPINGVSNFILDDNRYIIKSIIYQVCKQLIKNIQQKKPGNEVFSDTLNEPIIGIIREAGYADIQKGKEMEMAASIIHVIEMAFLRIVSVVFPGLDDEKNYWIEDFQCNLSASNDNNLLAMVSVRDFT